MNSPYAQFTFYLEHLENAKRLSFQRNPSLATKFLSSNLYDLERSESTILGPLMIGRVWTFTYQRHYFLFNPATSCFILLTKSLKFNPEETKEIKVLLNLLQKSYYPLFSWDKIISQVEKRLQFYKVKDAEVLTYPFTIEANLIMKDTSLLQYKVPPSGWGLEVYHNQERQPHFESYSDQTKSIVKNFLRLNSCASPNSRLKIKMKNGKIFEVKDGQKILYRK